VFFKPSTLLVLLAFGTTSEAEAGVWHMLVTWNKATAFVWLLKVSLIGLSMLPEKTLNSFIGA